MPLIAERAFSYSLGGGPLPQLELAERWYVIIGTTSFDVRVNVSTRFNYNSPVTSIMSYYKILNGPWQF